MVERVEMVDGRVYLTFDGWQTVFIQWRGGNRRRASPTRRRPTWRVSSPPRRQEHRR